jgi:hypothetical protein
MPNILGLSNQVITALCLFVGSLPDEAKSFIVTLYSYDLNYDDRLVRTGPIYLPPMTTDLGDR